jgi:hypothetical protein
MKLGDVLGHGVMSSVCHWNDGKIAKVRASDAVKVSRQRITLAESKAKKTRRRQGI